MAQEFRNTLESLATQYEAVIKENAELKSEVESLRSEVQSLKKKLLRANKKVAPSPDRALKKTPLQFWQTKTKVQVDWDPIPIEFPDSILCVNADSSTHCFGTADGEIYLFSAESNAQIAKVAGHSGAINSIVSEQSLGLYASCSGDGRINIWSPDTGRGFHMRRSSIDSDIINANASLDEHTGPIFAAAFISGDGHLVSGSQDNTICFWDVTHSSSCVHKENLKVPVISMSSLNDQQYVFAAGTQIGDIHFFDSRSKEPQLSLFHAKGPIPSICYAPLPTPAFVSAGVDEKIKLWDLRSPSDPIKVFDVEHVPTKIHARADNVIVPLEVGRTRIINLTTCNMALVEQSPFSYSISEAVLLNDAGNSFVATSWDGTACIGKIKPVPVKK